MIAEIEKKIEQGLFNKDVEKTFIDKLFAKDDIDHLRDIIKKTRLTRADMLEILYMLSSKEAKLVNYSEWERYIILKLFVWIRDFVKNAEKFYEYQEYLRLKEELAKKFKEFKEHELLEEEAKKLLNIQLTKEEIEQFTKMLTEKDRNQFILSDETKKMFDNIMKIKEGDVKFLVDLYLNISRTSLSLGATGFLETLKNKFEINYAQREIPQIKEEKGLFSMGKGGK